MIRGIAISGKAGAGKSSLARAFADELGGGVILAFGDQLKVEVKKLYGLEKNDPGGREHLIDHGESMRASDPLHWLFAVDRSIRSAQTIGRVPIIDDVRFRLEYEYLRALGFYLVRVEAHSVIRRNRLISSGADPFIVDSPTTTETSLDEHPFDFRVWNDGLAGGVDHLARAILRCIDDHQEWESVA